MQSMFILFIRRLALPLSLGLTLLLALLLLPIGWQPAAAQPATTLPPLVQSDAGLQAGSGSPVSQAAAVSKVPTGQPVGTRLAIARPAGFLRPVVYPAAIPMAGHATVCLNPTPLISDTLNKSQPDLSDDTALVAYIRDNEVFAYDRGDSPPGQSLTTDGGDTPSVSGNGQYIAYVRNNSIYRYNVTSTNVITVVAGEPAFIGPINSDSVINRDGTRIAYIVNGVEIKLAAEVGATLTPTIIPVVPAAGEFISHLAINADGTRIAYVSGDDVFLAEVDSGGTVVFYNKKLSSGVKSTTPSISDDGTRIAYAQDGNIHLAIVDASGTIVSNTSLITGDNNAEPAVSGDGHHIAYVKAGQIYMAEVNAAGNGVDSDILLASEGTNFQPVIDTVGSYIIFMHQDTGNGDDIYVAECPTADLALTKTVTPSVASRQGALTYTIIITNNGPSTVNAYTLTDQLPFEGDVTIKQQSVPGGSCQPPLNGVVTCTFGSLTYPNNNVTTATFVITSARGGQAVNTAYVTGRSDVPDGNPDNNWSTVTATIIALADMEVTKVAPATVGRNSPLTYTITITNHGPDEIGLITLTDVLPPEVMEDVLDADFSGGSYFFTWVVGGWLELDPVGKSIGSGNFTSRPLDAGQSISWQRLAWSEQRPIHKELPNTGQTDNYPTGNADMTGNVLLMHMNETSGQIIDSSGNNNVGTTSGISYGADGRFNGALQFDGYNDYVEVDNPTLNPTNQIAVSAWIYPTNWFGLKRIIQKGAGTFSSDYGQYSFYEYADTLRFTLDGIGTATSSNSVPLNTWHHVVGVYDGSSIQIWLNGSLVGQQFASGPMSSFPTDPLFIGARSTASGSDSFSGRIDEVAIYNRTLSPTEIMDLYLRGALRLKFQGRTCALSDCSDGGAFVGPNGTSFTFYQSTDPTNNSVVLTNLAANRYFQYRAYLETDHISYSPRLSQVAAGDAVSNVDISGCDTFSTVDNTVTCNISNLSVSPPAVEVTIVAIAPAKSGLVLSNRASVTAANIVDLFEDNNTTDPPVTTTVGLIDLEIDKTASPEILPAGGLLVYTITITNPQPYPAANVLLTDILPPGVIPVTLADNFDDNSLDSNLWQINTNIPAGGAAVTEQNGRLELKNRGHLITRQEYKPGAADLGSIRVKGLWTFNSWDDRLQILTRSDGQPGGANGQTQNGIEFYVQVGYASPVRIYRVENGTRTQLAETTIQYVDRGDTFAFDIFDDGQNVTFAITEVASTFIFDGLSASTAATTGADFPSNHVVFHNRQRTSSDYTAFLDNVQIATPELVNGCPFDTNTNTFTCTFDTLPPGPTLFTFLASPTQDGQIINQATVTTGDYDPNQGNDTDTAVTSVQPVADLRVAKSASPPTATVNSTISYAITVTNQGPSDLTTMATLIDTVTSQNLTNLNVPPACSLNNYTITCPVDTLASGSSQSFTISANTLSEPGIITNTAKVTSLMADSLLTNNVVTVTTLVDPVDLKITKVGAETAQKGNPLQYTIIITNNDNVRTAQNVTLVDQLAGTARVTVNSATPGGSCNGIGGSGPVTCNLGNLAPGQITTVNITVTPDTVGIITNTATVTSTNPDSNLANNTANVTTLVNPVDLAVDKVGPATGQSNTPVIYTITLVNNSPTVATVVTLTDQLTDTANVSSIDVTPKELVLEDDFSSGSIDPTRWLTKAGTSEADVEVTLNNKIQLTDRGYLVTSKQYDPIVEGGLRIVGEWRFINSTNDTLHILTRSDAQPGADGATQNGIEFFASLQDDYITINRRLDGNVSSIATMSKTLALSTIWYDFEIIDDGQNLSFTMTEQMGGGTATVTATNILTDFPTDYIVFHNGYVPGTTKAISRLDNLAITRTSANFCNPPTDQTITCIFTNLTQNQPVTVTVVAMPTQQGRITNTVNVTSLEPEISQNQSNNTDVVTTKIDPVDLVINKTGLLTRLAGQPLTYTITITNNSATNTVDAFTLLDTLTGASVDIGLVSAPDADGCSEVGNTISCDFSNLAAGNRVTATIVVTPTSAGVITNTASLINDANTNPNNTDVVVTTVSAATDLEVTKSAPGVKLAGEALKYTITITNHGPLAPPITLVDKLPSGATFNSFTSTPPGGTCTPAGDTVTCTPSGGSLNPNQSTTFEIFVTVMEPGTIINTVTGTSTMLDLYPLDNVATTMTTIEPVINLEVTKFASRAEALEQTPLTYTILITNYGPSTAQVGQITLTDTLTADIPLSNLVLGTPSPSGLSCTPWVNGEFTCTNNLALAKNATAMVTIVVTPTVSAGTITNTVTVTLPITILDPEDNNTSFVSNPIRKAANLAVTKLASNDEVEIGDPVHYTIVITNIGPSVVTATLIDTLLDTAGANKGQPQSQQPSCNPWVGDTFTCIFNSLGQNDFVTVSVVVTPTNQGTLVNTASVSGSELDPDEDDNEAEVTTFVNAVDLAVAKVASPVRPRQGETLTYTIVMTHKDSSLNLATNVTLTDTLEGASIVSVSPNCGHAGNIVTCTWGIVNVGDVKEVTMTAIADINTTSLFNVVEVTSNQPDKVSSDNRFALITEVDPADLTNLKLDKSVLPTSVAVGELLTYTITVRNEGIIDATNVIVTDTLPLEVSLALSMSGSFICTPPGTSAGGTVICNLGSALLAGTSQALQLVVTANQEGTVVNTARVASDNPEPDYLDNISTATAIVGSDALHVYLPLILKGGSNNLDTEDSGPATLYLPIVVKE